MLDNIKNDIEHSQTIMRIINTKIEGQSWLDPDQKESLAYRTASVLTAAKNLYTELTPVLTGEENRENMLEILGEFRMHCLNLTDLINEFEELFISSIIPEEGAELPDNHYD